MEAIIAIAAVLLFVVQAHRNTLILKQLKSQGETQIISVSSPDVEVKVTVDIDYDKLADALLSQPPAIVNVPPATVLPAPQPAVEPTYPYPYIVSDAGDPGQILATDNSIEINGVPAKEFPARF